MANLAGAFHEQLLEVRHAIDALLHDVENPSVRLVMNEQINCVRFARLVGDASRLLFLATRLASELEFAEQLAGLRSDPGEDEDQSDG